MYIYILLHPKIIVIFKCIQFPLMTLICLTGDRYSRCRYVDRFKFSSLVGLALQLHIFNVALMIHATVSLVWVRTILVVFRSFLWRLTAQSQIPKFIHKVPELFQSIPWSKIVLATICLILTPFQMFAHTDQACGLGERFSM